MIFQKDDTLDKYQIIKFLGSGNFGEAYYVLDRVLKTKQVIKVFKRKSTTNEELRDELHTTLTEAKIQVSLTHDHIVKINQADISSDRNFLYIDMEYLPKSSLGSKMNTSFLSVDYICKNFIKILSAVEYIHTNNLLHRDIKPDNILLDANEVWKLSDFGLSTHKDNLTLSKGYRTHLPPECFTTLEGDHLHDIYSAGMTLYRLVNNFKNWDHLIGSISEEDIRAGKTVSKIGFQPWVPQKIVRIIKKATHKVPEKRFQTITEFKNKIANLSLGITWIFKTETLWEGTFDKFLYSIELNQMKKKGEFQVLIKRNDRRQTALTKNFDSKVKAEDYFFEHIRNTSIN